MRTGAALVIAVVAFTGTRAFAQADLSGEWGNLLHEDVNHRNDAIGGGPRIGDYTGLPINDAARLRADSWDAALNTVREHQTVFAPAAYWARGGGGLRISKVMNDDTQEFTAEAVDEISGRPEGFVPHHLPGHNPWRKDAALEFGIPEDALRGGRETTYPEYRTK